MAPQSSQGATRTPVLDKYQRRETIDVNTYQLLFGVSAGILAGIAGLYVLEGFILIGYAAYPYVEALVGFLPVAQAMGTGSMEPHINGGETVIHDDGLRSIDEGDVIVFHPPDDDTATVHRAHFYVEEGEDWYDRTEPELVDVDDCDELRNCPAPNDGWITSGDALDEYDQARGYAPPVKDEWIEGSTIWISPL